MVGTTGSRACDCVEVYLQSSGQRVFKMTFHHSMSFKQIVLVGQETQRALLLLTGDRRHGALQTSSRLEDLPGPVGEGFYQLPAPALNPKSSRILHRISDKGPSRAELSRDFRKRTGPGVPTLLQQSF